MLSTPSRVIADSSLARPGLYSSTAMMLWSASFGAMATVEVPVPQPISTMVGPVRPNHSSTSIFSSESTVPTRSQCSSQIADWPGVRVPRRKLTPPMRGYSRPSSNSVCMGRP